MASPTHRPGDSRDDHPERVVVTLCVAKGPISTLETDLGERVGVWRQAVTAIETGKFDPSLPLALKLARLFGQRVEESFFLDEE